LPSRSIDIALVNAAGVVQSKPDVAKKNAKRQEVMEAIQAVAATGEVATLLAV
jgi:hypothetical protein